MLKIAICDDETEHLDRTQDYITQWAEENEVDSKIECFTNGDNLLSILDNKTFDIIFLDIIMPLLNGLDTAKEIRTRDKAVKIVFLTSSPEFALSSYDVKAYDYILKPIKPIKLREILNQCTADSDLEPNSVTLKTSFGYQKIYYHNIEYIEAQNKKVLIHMRDCSTLQVLQPLKSFEEVLTNNLGFFKCHRSYIVYLQNVDHFNMTELVTKSGVKIPIARGYGKPFQEAYFKIMFKM